MAATAELESLVVKLIGDASSLQAMFRQVSSSAVQTAQAIQTAFSSASRAMIQGMSEAARVSTRMIQGMSMAGKGPATFATSPMIAGMSAAGQFAASSSAQMIAGMSLAGQQAAQTEAARAAAMQRAAQITQQAMTAAQRYAVTVAELNVFLGKGLITQQVYNQAVIQARQAMAGTRGMSMELIMAVMSLTIAWGAMKKVLFDVTNAYSKFNLAMQESISIMSVTPQQIQEMTTQARELSKVSNRPPEDLAKAYFHLASAGLNAKEAIKFLPAVLDFAVAGSFNLSEATSLSTRAMVALGMRTKDADANLTELKRVMDVLAEANKFADANIREFSLALTNDAAAAAKIYGKEVEEVTAVLAAYAQQGVIGLEAGTDLARFLRILSKTATEDAEAHKLLNFQVFDSTGQMRNLGDIVADLEKRFKGMSHETRAATMAQMGFEVRMQNAVLPLIGMSDKIKEWESDLNEAGGTTKKISKTVMEAFSNQVQMLSNQFSVFATTIGEALAPTLLGLGKGLSYVLEIFDKLPESTRTVLAFLIGLAPILITIAAVSPLVAYGFGAIATTLTAMNVALATSPFGLIVIGVTAAVAAIIGLAGAFHQVKEAQDEVIKKQQVVVDEVTKVTFAHEQEAEAIRNATKEAVARLKVLGTRQERIKFLEEELKGTRDRAKRMREEIESLKKILKVGPPVTPEMRFRDPDLFEKSLEMQAEAKNRLTTLEAQLGATDQATAIYTRHLNQLTKSTGAWDEAIVQIGMDMNKLEARLKLEIATTRMTSEEIALYQIQQQITNDTIRKAVEDRHSLIKALVAEHKQVQENTRLWKKGQDMIDDLLTPQEKYNEAVKELRKIYEQGGFMDKNMPGDQAREWELYQRALKKVTDEFKKAAGSAEDFNAVAFGSAEHLGLLLKYQRAMQGTPAERGFGIQSIINRFRGIQRTNQQSGLIDINIPKNTPFGTPAAMQVVENREVRRDQTQDRMATSLDKAVEWLETIAKEQKKSSTNGVGLVG